MKKFKFFSWLTAMIIAGAIILFIPRPYQNCPVEKKSVDVEKRLCSDGTMVFHPDYVIRVDSSVNQKTDSSTVHSWFDSLARSK